MSTTKTNSKYTEDWLPVRNIANGMIELDNKMKVTGVKIRPRNIFILDTASRNSIISVLKNTRKSAGGYYWKYNDGKQYPITEISHKTPIPIAQIEIYNGFVHHIYPSIQEASRQTGINSSMISQCLNGTIANTGYWKWSYINNLTNEQKISSQYKNSPYRLKDNAIEGKSIFEMSDEEYELFLKEIEEI